MTKQINAGFEYYGALGPITGFDPKIPSLYNPLWGGLSRLPPRFQLAFFAPLTIRQLAFCLTHYTMSHDPIPRLSGRKRNKFIITAMALSGINHTIGIPARLFPRIVTG